MAINLADVPGAVKTYLDTKVSVGISPFTPIAGVAIGPNETFTFNVEVRNAIPLAGGVALSNVKYRIAVTNPAVAKIRVPGGGTSTTLNFPFTPLPMNEFVDGFIYSPTGDNFSLSVGEIDNLPLTGKAGAAGGGGTTAINARILADVDLNQLFPKGQDSTPATKNLTVVG